MHMRGVGNRHDNDAVRVRRSPKNTQACMHPMTSPRMTRRCCVNGMPVRNDTMARHEDSEAPADCGGGFTGCASHALVRVDTRANDQAYFTTSTDVMPTGSSGASERSVATASSLSTTALDASSATSPKMV